LAAKDASEGHVFTWYNDYIIYVYICDIIGCRGDNTHGQLGQGHHEASLVPMMVALPVVRRFKNTFFFLSLSLSLPLSHTRQQRRQTSRVFRLAAITHVH
jgi:alpha-tubulin suppressor-like RCC1 family protein